MYPAGFKLVHNAHPELGSLVLLYPYPAETKFPKLFLAVQTYCQGQIDRLFNDLRALPGYWHAGHQKTRWVKRFQEAAPPFIQHPLYFVRYPAY
jgi:hypothetical protein